MTPRLSQSGKVLSVVVPGVSDRKRRNRRAPTEFANKKSNDLWALVDVTMIELQQTQNLHFSYFDHRAGRLAGECEACFYTYHTGVRLSHK